MQLIGQSVTHITFGAGRIVDQKDRFVYVDFGTATRRFAYPDAFSCYLTLADADRQKEADARYKLSVKAEQAQREALRAQRERLEQLRTMKVSPQSQAAFALTPEEAAACLEAGVVSAGTYLSGSAKGQPKVPSRIKPNSACLLTAKPAGGKEADRQILGVFMAGEDYFGADCTDGLVRAHPEYRILLSPQHTLPLWKHYPAEERPTHWGHTAFKYLDTVRVHQILYELMASLAHTEQKDQAKALYQYFCYVNRLPERIAE